MSSLLYFVLLALLTQLVAFGQFGSAIQGTVLDSTGAVVPRARLRVVSVATGVAREAVSAEDGVYRVPSLSPGVYRVTAEREGFKSAEQDDVTIGADEVRRVDFSLNVGNIAERITVSATVTALETEKGRLSGKLESAQLKELPVAGRNVYNLLALQPGVTGRTFGSDVYSGEPAPAVRAAGQRPESNYFSVDDTSINSISRGGTVNLTPNIDSVAEVRVSPNNFSAEDGRNSGAQIQIISKSGTNQFHGSVSEYFQNNTLAARNVFETFVPVFRQHQFGYSVGGPVVKNRTFFFHSYEGLRRSGARASISTVETPEFRDFVVRTRPNSIAAKLLRDFQPSSYPTFNFRDLGSPLPGANRWGPADGIMDVGSVSFVPDSVRNGDQFNVRVDHELRPGKDRLYGNWYRTKGFARTDPLRPAFVRPQTDIAHFGNLNHTHIFSPAVLNEFRAGVMRLAGMPSAPQNQFVPEIGITGSTGFQDVNVFPGGWFQTSLQMRNTLSWVRGAHSLRFGGELRRMRNNLRNTRSFIPVYSFAGLLDFADDEALQMSRTVDPRTGTPAITDNAIRVWEGSIFVQNDWKVKRNLTFNLGLRYEYYGPMTDAKGRLRNFLFGEGSSYEQRVASGRVDVVPSMWPSDKMNFGPRFGFAWDLGGNGKNVIRGGYGMSFDRMATVVPGSYRDNPPLTAVATLGVFFGTPFTYTLGDTSKPYLGYPVDPGLQLGLDSRNGIRGARVAVVSVDPGFRTPTAHDWFLGYQRALPAKMVLEIGLLGTAGHNLINVTNVNRFAGDLLDGRLDTYNPSFNVVRASQSTSNSIYHGGTVALRRAFSRGLTIQSSFTYGKIITDAETAQGDTNYYYANNRRLDRALASFDVPRRFTFMGIYELPFLKGCPSLACKIAGGWQVSGFMVWEKGFPLSVVSTAPWPRGDFNADGTNFDRPHAPAASIPRKGYSRQQLLTGIFAASDFPLPAGGVQGNLGRSTFRGPNFTRVDMSVGKTFRITERLSTVLRLEAFNALNQVVLNNPVTDLVNINFGRSTSAQQPRSLQVSLQVRF